MNELYKVWNNANHLKGVVGTSNTYKKYIPLAIDFTKKSSVTWITGGTKENREKLIINIFDSMAYNSHQGQFEIAFINFENKKNKMNNLKRYLDTHKEYQSPLTYSIVNSSYQKIINLKNEKVARMEYFNAHDYKSINDFNRSESKTMPYIFLVLTNLQYTQLKEKQNWENNLKFLINDTTDVGIRTIITMENYQMIFNNSDLIASLRKDITMELNEKDSFSISYRNSDKLYGKLLQSGDSDDTE